MRRVSLAAPETLLQKLQCTEAFEASPSTSTVSSFSTVASYGRHAMHHTRRRSLPIQRPPHGGRTVLGQLPSNRRRPSSDTKLNVAQHPHVQPMTDSKIQRDDRALTNLALIERESITINPLYPSNVQPELSLENRKQVVEWMKDVTVEEKCDDEVFPLAVLLLDCFLSVQQVFRRDVQGMAGSCLLVASKLKAPCPLTSGRLSYYTDHSVTPSQIMSWELLILKHLNWKVALPTAFDFASQLFARDPSLYALKRQFADAVAEIQMNFKQASMFPSVQCAMALTRVVATHPPFHHLFHSTRHLISTCLHINTDLLLQLSWPIPNPMPSSSSVFLSPSTQPLWEENGEKSSPPSTPSGMDSGFCSAQTSPEQPPLDVQLSSPHF